MQSIHPSMWFFSLAGAPLPLNLFSLYPWLLKLFPQFLWRSHSLIMKYIVTLLWWQVFIRWFFSSPPLHTWDNNDYQSHHANLGCHYWVRVWKGCSRENHLYAHPALIEGHNRMAPVSLTLNDLGLCHFRGRQSPKFWGLHFFISHSIYPSFPLCLFNN